MINIQNVLFTKLKKSFSNKYDIIVNDNFFNIFHNGNHGIDYNMQLIKFQKYLEKYDIKITCEELFNVLTDDLNPEYYVATFARNSVNINLTNKCISVLMNPLLNNDVVDIVDNPQNILVDFSSPNIAKDMHVGHLRSTIIGDSVCKLYEMLGHNVFRINHIGDWGLQFGMIIQHLLEKYPDYNNANLTIEDLQNLYAESKKRFDTESDFKDMAYKKVVLLQSTEDKVVVSAWNFIKKISRLAYDDIYNRLDVKLYECGESFYQDKIPFLIEELESKGILVEDNNRKIIKLDNYELPLTIIKSDGGYTYDTTDLAAVRYRLVDLNMDKVIYVVDEGQSLHFELVFEVAKIMGWKKDSQTLIHVGFGLVLDAEGKKFQSRKGDTVKLKDLLNESLVIANKVFDSTIKIREENNNKTGNNSKIENKISDDEKKIIVRNIAYGSVKYADLSSMRTNTYKFSIEKMVSLKGNTGAYNLYEYVRICAIIRNAKEYANNLPIQNFNIEEQEEATVCKLILLFPEILERVTTTLMFHWICSYMYELTGAFSGFYKNCRTLMFNKEKELIGVNENRLLICIATKTILEKCFLILGINTLERM